MRFRIRPARAIGILTVLTIVAISMAVVVVLLDLRANALTQDVAQTDALARLLAEQTRQTFERDDATLQSIADRLQSSFVGQLGLDSMPVHLLLSSRQQGLGETSALFIADADGIVVNSTRQFPAVRISVADRPYFRAFGAGKQQGLYIGVPLSGRATGVWTLHLARALRNPDGSLRGVLVAAVTSAALEPLYAYIQQDFGRPVALYLADGRLLASLPRRDELLGLQPPELVGMTLPRPGQLQQVDVVRSDGEDDRMALQRVPGFPLLVGVSDNMTGALSSWRAVAFPIAGGAFLVCLLVGSAALLLARQLERDDRHNRALREADDRWRRTIDSVMDAIVSVDAQGDIIMFNPAAERMFGMSASQAFGLPLSTLIPDRLRDLHVAHVAAFERSGVSSREMAP
ncbi:MAG: cache domain-containing protein, partial [Thiomonas sp.]